MKTKWESFDTCKEHQRGIANLRQKEARHQLQQDNRQIIHSSSEKDKQSLDDKKKLVENQVSTDLRNGKEKMPSPLIEVLAKHVCFPLFLVC